jgi:hypothetical protein
MVMGDFTAWSVYRNNAAIKSFMTLRASAEFVSAWSLSRLGAYKRQSVILTRLVSYAMSFRATWSERAFQSSLSTRTCTRGERRASHRYSWTRDAVTRGGRSCRVSTASNRGLCREMRSKAGCRYDVSPGLVDEEEAFSGRRYSFSSIMKIPWGSASFT